MMYKPPGNFRARIELFSSSTTKNKFNGIRWSFVYVDDFNALGASQTPQSDVWPVFLMGDGVPIPDNVPLRGTLTAIMHIVFPEMVDVHFKKLEVGTQFYCIEGAKRMAIDTVIGLTPA